MRSPGASAVSRPPIAARRASVDASKLVAVEALSTPVSQDTGVASATRPPRSRPTAPVGADSVAPKRSDLRGSTVPGCQSRRSSCRQSHVATVARVGRRVDAPLVTVPSPRGTVILGCLVTGSRVWGTFRVTFRRSRRGVERRPWCRVLRAGIQIQMVAGSSVGGMGLVGTIRSTLLRVRAPGLRPGPVVADG
jgi:hypothetical protein